MTMQSGFYSFVRLKSITRSDEGLAIRAMCRDREGALWLGGKNGLIRVGRDATTWFKSDGGPADRKISHNKIRSLYADDKGVWIASDGGLDRYEYATGRFRQFTVTEPTGRYNSSWMYGICEDNRGRLWISTYEGGVFVVDKKRLLATPGRSYCADMHFSTDNRGFPSNITSKITISNDRCFVATDEGTVSIDTGTGRDPPRRPAQGRARSGPRQLRRQGLHRDQHGTLRLARGLHPRDSRAAAAHLGRDGRRRACLDHQRRHMSAYDTRMRGGELSVTK